MSSKKASSLSDHGLDGLSLTGSQVGTPMSSARSVGRPSSAKVANKPSGARLKSSSATNINGVGGGAIAKNKSSRPNKSGPNSARSVASVSTYHDTPRTTNQDSARSKNTLSSPSQQNAGNDFLSLFESANPTKPKAQGSKTTTKSKTAWGSTVDTPRSQAELDVDHTSRAGSKTSKFTHSVFQPVSARSNSTVDDNELENNLNFNVDSKTSLKEDPSYQCNNARGHMAPHQRHKSSSKENLFAQRQRCGSGEDLSLNRGRNPGAGGDANDFLNSHQNVSSQKATKLNSIANNMTSQAFSPGNKASLLGLENSYQNIKHKTPINQVRQSPQPLLGRNIAEDFVKTCNMAATKIQRWFRRNGLRKKTSEAAMKRMLETKRREMEEARMSSNNEEIDRESKRKQDREEKARLARLEAISELQKKREIKREETKRKAEEEVKFLQASGKITKKPANKSNVKKKQTDQTRPKTHGYSKVSGSDSEDGAAAMRPATSRSNGRTVDNFFQNNGSDANRQANSKSGSNSPRSDHSEDQLDNPAPEGAVGNFGNESSPRPSQATTAKTTLEDLMATLQKLEAEEKFASARKDKNENPTSWLDELEKKSEDSDKDDYRLSADALEHLSQPKPDNLVKSGLLTDEKLRSIMTYLDDVEMAERLTEIDNEIAKANEILDRPAPLVPSGEEIVEIEQATAHAAEVTNKMLTQKMELEEKKRTVQMLQKALNQQRELTVRHAKETEKELKKRLDVQKDEYEETIKRHLSFIDQLIDDKKSLSEKCENLVKELKVIDRKYQEKIKSITDSHEVETRKLKDVQAAAEKIRREKWIEEKTKKIKEMTVKGLEPEIQRLIAKHKSEIKKIKSIHEAELLASDERAGQRYVQMTEELRDQLAKEKEMACSRERELARQTYEKQLQSEEEAFQQQRRRLYTEVQEEKERIAQQASRQRSELDRLQRQLEDAHGKTISVTRSEYEKARDEQEKRHHLELKQLKEQLAVEKASWEENYIKKQETWVLQKERELKEQVRKERDREIEMVIQRLEEDNQASREECERVADNRIKRIRDKYESEMSELERSERQTMEKYNQTKAMLAEIEGESERTKVTLKQKDREVNEVKKLLDKLNHERDHVSDVIRQEFADKIVSTDEENRRLKNEMSELKSRHRIELERGKAEIEVVQKGKEEEMEEVHKRVKQAILKKEDIVTQLKQQYQAAVKRADHLEGLLEQQRKQLLGKK